MPRLSRRRAGPALGLLGALAFGAGCAAQRQAGAVAPGRLVWPAPPDPARIEFVRAIRYPSDVTGRAPGALQRLATGGETPLFSRPYGVAADSVERLYVADPIEPALWRLDFATGETSRLGTSGPGMLQRPCCVATVSDGRVFVSDVDGKRVVVFDRTGRFLFAFGGRQVMSRPAGLAIDEVRRRIYIADLARHRVTVHDLGSGDLLFDFGGRGSREGEFNVPLDVAVDSAGRVYVLDALNFRVQRFNPEGRFLDSFGTAGDGPGQFARPKGLALDAEDNVYVVDAAFGNFQIFGSGFELLMSVGQNGSELGQFALPAGIAVACDHTIYVADGLNARVQIFRRVDRAGRCASTAPQPAP